MKALLRVVVVSMFLLIIASQFSFGQLAFGVKPAATLQGTALNSAYFGYKISNLVIYGGFEYIHAGGDVDIKETGSATLSYSVSANVCVPYIGAKYFLLNSGSIKGYVSGNISKPWLSFSGTEDGEELEITSGLTVKDVVGDIKLWGFQVAVGSEYFFSDNFSIGGEFGVRLLTGSFNKDIGTDVNLDVSAGASLTYSALTLNYYF